MIEGICIELSEGLPSILSPCLATSIISWWKPPRIHEPRWLFLVISCTQIAQHLDFIAQRQRSRNICRAWWNRACLIGYPIELLIEEYVGIVILPRRKPVYAPLARSQGTARRNVSRMLGLNTNRCVHNIAECLTILFFKKRLQGAHPQTKWIELLV